MSIGLIERRGNRSFVAEQLPTSPSTAPRKGRAEFVRQLFEDAPHARGDDHRTPRRADGPGAEIATLAAALRPDLSIDEFRQLDRRFHGAIARACGNPLLVEVYSKVRARSPSRQGSTRCCGTIACRRHHLIAEAIDAHTAISAAIAGGDVAAAGARAAHLDRIERRILARVG